MAVGPTADRISGAASAPMTAAEPISPTVSGADRAEKVRSRTRPGLAVVAATTLFFAVCLGFLVNTPSGIAPDEIYQFDRVIAASHGQVILDPEEINVSQGARGYQKTYVATMMWAGSPSWAEYLPLMRDQRPSLAELGGNQRSLDQDVSNYMTQHPPLYYALLGGLTWLVPGGENMPADALFLLLRFFNILLLLPLPLVFWYGARQLVGPGAVAAAAAFLPLLVPGMAKIASSINNDNLAVILGALLLALSIKVMLGNLGLRTALLLCLVAVAGSLTKGTIVFLLIIIPFAYALGVARTRRWPAPKVLIVLGIGAAVAAAWWIRNLILFGDIQPSATGAMTAAANGPVRPPDVPIDYDWFWYNVYIYIPSRFFGSLGLLEPPELPIVIIRGLAGLILVCIPIAVAALRGRRWAMAAVAALPFAELVALLYQVYEHYTNFLILPGLQGRYLYPAAFGLLIPIAIVVGLVLRQQQRWTPMVIAIGGLLVSGWALYISVEYTWLHRGENLAPSNWVRAFRTLVGFFPLPGPVTVVLALLVGALAAAGVVMTVLACTHAPWAGPAATPTGSPTGSPTGKETDSRPALETPSDSVDRADPIVAAPMPPSGAPAEGADGIVSSPRTG